MKSDNDSSAVLTSAVLTKFTPWLFFASGLLFFLAGFYPLVSKALGSGNSEDVNPAFIAVGGAFLAFGAASGTVARRAASAEVSDVAKLGRPK